MENNEVIKPVNARVEPMLPECTYSDFFSCVFRVNNDCEPSPADCRICVGMQIVEFLVYQIGPYLDKRGDADG